MTVLIERRLKHELYVIENMLKEGRLVSVKNGGVAPQVPMAQPITEIFMSQAVTLME
ncbi:hypothetical protein RQP54_06700 [Curvibacter sp. APW13]|uniref:hypothetical protein n=1 Tax=Curvibacter sp. APW13 TaxID=3077236 RepID=UPI0028E07142|nr:hypothetical protein [Curvibacter sp. APW13]MDT8990553.1 hypothetical protein [Curvibacter sp. APW13]